MSYSLFDNKCSFTEILHGKSDSELIIESDLSKNPSSSGKVFTNSSKSSDNNDSSSNVFLLKVLDSLLEVCDGGHPIRLSTHLPSPSFVSTAPHHILPPPVMRILPSSVAKNHTFPPQSVHYQPHHSFTPVPLVPTPHLMSIPPPPIRYFH